MTKEKKDLPPMPEHDGSENCPACAEIERVMKEMEDGPLIARFKKFAEYVRDEHTAIENEFGVRITSVFGAILENDQTDRIGISTKEYVIKSRDKEKAMDILMDINKAVIMRDLESLEKRLRRKTKPSSEGHVFMGKPGQA